MYIVKRVIVSVIVLIIGVTSFWGVSAWAENPKTYTETTSKIEKFQDNALALTATATGMATAAALVPGDTTTPLANKLADVAGYMVVVYAALTMEKYMMTLSGLLLFKLIIPALSLFTAAIVLIKGMKYPGRWKIVFAKILLVGIALWALVPSSMYVSTMVQDMYDASAEIKIEQAEKENKQLELEAEQSKVDASEEESSFFAKLYGKVKDKASDAKLSVNQKINKYEAALDNLIEGVAVLIVTTCVIPLAVMVLMMWLVKLIVAPGTEFKVPKLPRASKLTGRRKQTDDEQNKADQLDFS